MLKYTAWTLYVIEAYKSFKLIRHLIKKEFVRYQDPHWKCTNCRESLKTEYKFKVIISMS